MPWTKKQKQEYNKKYNKIHPRDRREYNKEWYLKNKTKAINDSKEYYFNNKEERKKYMKKYREEHKDRNILEHKRITMDVLSYYSNGNPKCACCGETIIEFLTIDHINGHTENDVRVKFISKSQPYYRFIAGYKLYRWLRQNNYPEGYQVLCFNCNCGKNRTNNKVCPHKRI